jgi:hypothetical protein
VRVGRPPERATRALTRPGLTERIEAALSVDGAAVLTYGTLSPTTDLSLWVTATSRSAVITAYALAWAGVSGVASVPGVGAPDPEGDAERLLTWLDGTDRRWLVVLDDVQDPADLVTLWPKGGAGRVLVTTRRRDRALLDRSGAAIDVGVFTPQESAAYLAQRLGTRARVAGRGAAGLDNAALSADVAGLAEHLGHLPLALDSAATLIADQGWTCAEYRHRFAAAGASLGTLLSTCGSLAPTTSTP